MILINNFNNKTIESFNKVYINLLILLVFNQMRHVNTILLNCKQNYICNSSGSHVY